MPYIFKNITVDDESVELEASYLGLTLEEFVKKFGLKEIQNTTDQRTMQSKGKADAIRGQKSFSKSLMRQTWKTRKFGSA